MVDTSRVLFRPCRSPCISPPSPFLLAASAHAQLHKLGKKAGLKYFGAATDSPGQRERAGFETAYEQYDAILNNIDEFGQTTPTNGQKWLFTEPERGVFNFTEGDIPARPWVEEGEWTADELREIITTHITEVAGHYKGKCYAWDVVNEALNEDGTWRESVFYNVLGEEYIKLAFQVASEVDPDAKLYYNDYNLESVGPKSKAAVEIVKMLRDDGIKIDGIGMQAHLIAHQAPSFEDQLAVIDLYAAADVEVAYTELDVRLETPTNATNLEWQSNVYRDSVAACVQSEACIGLTLWDFYDPFSWVPFVFEGEGAALLWFEDFETHPAYDAVIEVLKKAGKPSGGSCKSKRRSLKH
ncbi:unnamed protein product [Parascedosporium putredinis]|uniref:Beta-xylanase n=1 Tax=Parascedosporium putredinis TaxID=1442378 RepID=A0A9P1ME23_9PEZI|nr:unnamed protein product [Parascedosporium putredinis]CAI8004800.1 unnamed protein product [Parascedosporium putredinis]